MWKYVYTERNYTTFLDQLYKLYAHIALLWRDVIEKCMTLDEVYLLYVKHLVYSYLREKYLKIPKGHLKSYIQGKTIQWPNEKGQKHKY